MTDTLGKRYQSVVIIVPPPQTNRDRGRNNNRRVKPEMELTLTPDNYVGNQAVAEIEMFLCSANKTLNVPVNFFLFDVLDSIQNGGRNQKFPD